MDRKGRAISKLRARWARGKRKRRREKRGLWGHLYSDGQQHLQGGPVRLVCRGSEWSKEG